MPTITITLDGVSQSVEISKPPMRASWWYSALPAAATLHPSSAAIVAEIVRQAGLAQPIVNGSQATPTWTAPVTVVPAGQPLVPVVVTQADSTMRAIGATGIPLPPGITATPDSDSAVLIYQPDAANGGFAGWYWELQGFGYGADGKTPTCHSLARKGGVNTRTEGRFVNWTGGPGGSAPAAVYSTYELQSWGIQGSGLPYAPGVLTLDDINRGYVNHALLLEVYDAGAGQHVWPAVSRSDGGAASGTPAYILAEGMWLRLPAGYVIPAGLSRTTALVMQAARDYGLIITDRTLACLAVRCAPDCRPRIDDAHLTGFAWGDLQCLTPGSDSIPHPVS